MSKKKRILIIDDDKGICKSLSIICCNEGYETEMANTGHGGLEKAMKNFFDIVFLDIGLPDRIGMDLLPILKKIHPDMAIIILTGHASFDTAMSAFNNGASAYILKPFDINEVLYKIRDVIEKQDLISENKRLYLDTKRELEERKQIEETLRESEEMYRSLVELCPDPIIIFQDNHHSLINSSYRDLFGYTIDDLNRLNFYDLLPDHEKEAARKRIGDRFAGKELPKYYHTEIIAKTGKVITCEVSGTLINFKGRPADMVIFRDVTAKIQTEKERERLIIELKQALDNVKMLKGLLPICSSCKKIRDDKGYWNKIEKYIIDHSEATFTHGICPECANRLYGNEIWYNNDDFS